jgi:hypothetical protein
MAWAKLDDRFHRHRKVDDLSLEAIGLWTKSLSYCADYLTDGFVEQRWVNRELPQKRRRESIVGNLISAVSSKSWTADTTSTTTWTTTTRVRRSSNGASASERRSVGKRRAPDAP